LAEYKIISLNNPKIDFPGDPKTFLNNILQSFKSEEKNINQIIRDLSIFRILSSGIYLKIEEKVLFDKILHQICLPLNSLFCNAHQEVLQGKSFSQLLLFLYELKIIFFSEIIFHPEFCVD